MHTEVLPETSGELLATLTSRGTTEFHGWVLAGGTGLALQLGHRISEDFDFFCTREVDTVALFDRLREVATCETLYSDEHTLTVLVDGVLYPGSAGPGAAVGHAGAATRAGYSGLRWRPLARREQQQRADLAVAHRGVELGPGV